MAREFSLGRMADATKANILMIKNKVMECLYGLTEGSMMENGSTENNMERVSTTLQKEKLRKENGKRERESDG